MGHTFLDAFGSIYIKDTFRKCQLFLHRLFAELTGCWFPIGKNICKIKITFILQYFDLMVQD